MANIFNPDFQDFIRAFNNHQVEYLLVGGYAVIIHGYNRTTGDMDIWVEKTPDNYRRIVAAFREFGMPVFDMTEKNFCENPEMNVFTFGTPPVSIDLMTDVKGLDFQKVIHNADWHDLDGLKIRVIHLQDLLKAKSASNRPKDQDDLQHLKKGD